MREEEWGRRNRGKRRRPTLWDPSGRAAWGNFSFSSCSGSGAPLEVKLGEEEEGRRRRGGRRREEGERCSPGVAHELPVYPAAQQAVHLTYRLIVTR